MRFYNPIILSFTIALLSVMLTSCGSAEQPSAETSDIPQLDSSAVDHYKQIEEPVEEVFEEVNAEGDTATWEVVDAPINEVHELKSADPAPIMDDEIAPEPEIEPEPELELAKESELENKTQPKPKAKPKPNPVPKPEPEPEIATDSELEYVEQKGALTIFCERKMKLNQEYPVAAFISTVLEKLELDSTVQSMTLESSSEMDSEEVEANTNSYTIVASNRMRVVMKVDTAKMKILKYPSIHEQDLSGRDMVQWNWLVQPTKAVGQNLVFYTYRLHPQSGEWREHGFPQNFKVKVGVNPAEVTSSLWIFLTQNPEYLLSQILIPIITFLAGFLGGKRKKKKTEELEEE